MAKEKIIGIYKITSPSGRIYIGQAVDINRRWNYYKRMVCNNQVKLFNSFKKHGIERHDFEILSTLDVYDKNDLDRLEVFYIKHFDTFETLHGLNLKEGGANGKHSQESIEKRENTKRLKKEEQIKNGTYVKKKLSENHINILIESNKGRKRTQQQNEHHSEIMKGRKMSPESIEKRTKKVIGVKQTSERVAKRVETKKIKKEEQIKNGTYVKITLSEETRRRQSESKKGKKQSQEHINKRTKNSKGRKKSPESVAKRMEIYNNKTQEEKNIVREKIEETKRLKREESKLNGTYIKRTISEEQRNKLNEAKRMIRQERLSMIF